jgi:hypothetical protein
MVAAVDVSFNMSVMVDGNDLPNLPKRADGDQTVSTGHI